jgi:hypothetical protein
MIALYNKRISELKGDELYKYMCKAAPFVMEYHTSKNKNDLFKEYLATVEENNQCSMEIIQDKCLKCNSSNLLFDDISSDIVCVDCGCAEYVTGDGRGYKEEQDNEPCIQYSYKRENHFNEWIAQFQAQEVTNIPQSIFTDIRNELKKTRKTKDQISESLVRSILKKLKLTKYYEHVAYITSILSGVNPPLMPKELEDKLRRMFYMIQEPFHKNKPDERKNFLSYSYILYKFCELLSEDSYLPCFPLLKSKEKLMKQDLIWKEICKELRWEFITTV